MVDCRGARTPLPPGTNIEKTEKEISSNFKMINGKSEVIQKQSKKNRKPKATNGSKNQFNRMNILKNEESIPSY